MFRISHRASVCGRKNRRRRDKLAFGAARKSKIENRGILLHEVFGFGLGFFIFDSLFSILANFAQQNWMGWQDSNLRMSESKSEGLPTCRHPNTEKRNMRFPTL